MTRTAHVHDFSVFVECEVVTFFTLKGGRLIPLVTCIGNHEVDVGYGKTREKAPFFYALFDGLFTDAGFTKLTRVFEVVD